MKYILLIIAFITVTAHAQRTDSLKQDSTRLDEMLLRQQQQQSQIDSLIRLRLQQELKNASGDAQRTKELETKLNQIQRNDSLRKADQLRKIEALKQTSKPYAIAPFGDTLFYINLGLGSFKAKERADIITDHIRKLYDDEFFKKDSLQLIKNEND